MVRMGPKPSRIQRAIFFNAVCFISAAAFAREGPAGSDSRGKEGITETEGAVWSTGDCCTLRATR